MKLYLFMWSIFGEEALNIGWKGAIQNLWWWPKVPARTMILDMNYCLLIWSGGSLLAWGNPVFSRTNFNYIVNYLKITLNSADHRNESKIFKLNQLEFAGGERWSWSMIRPRTRSTSTLIWINIKEFKSPTSAPSRGSTPRTRPSSTLSPDSTPRWRQRSRSGVRNPSARQH